MNCTPDCLSRSEISQGPWAIDKRPNDCRTSAGRVGNALIAKRLLVFRWESPARLHESNRARNFVPDKKKQARET